MVMEEPYSMHIFHFTSPDVIKPEESKRGGTAQAPEGTPQVHTAPSITPASTAPWAALICI